MEDENQNVGKEQEKFYPPAYGCDEWKKDGFIRVVAWIRGMTTTTELEFQGILPKLVKKPTNAEVDVVIEKCSLCVTVRGKSGDMKWKNYQLNINKLLHDIIPEESYHEFRKESVVLFLRKKEDISWLPQMKYGIRCREDGDGEAEKGHQKKRQTKIRNEEEELEASGEEADVEDDGEGEEEEEEENHLIEKKEGESESEEEEEVVEEAEEKTAEAEVENPGDDLEQAEEEEVVVEDEEVGQVEREGEIE